MKHALKALTLSLLIIAPIIAHEGCESKQAVEITKTETAAETSEKTVAPVVKRKSHSTESSETSVDQNQLVAIAESTKIETSSSVKVA